MSEHAAAKLLAEQLSGQHIDRIVRFVTDVGAGRVRATITAELRQIYHVAGFTTLSLTARDWITGLDCAPSTITDIHGVLAAILDTAVEERRIAANPARGVTPGADGWLTIHTDHATGCTTVTRIRWEDTALYAPADLDRMEHQ